MANSIQLYTSGMMVDKIKLFLQTLIYIYLNYIKHVIEIRYTHTYFIDNEQHFRFLEKIHQSFTSRSIFIAFLYKITNKKEKPSCIKIHTKKYMCCIEISISLQYRYTSNTLSQYIDSFIRYTYFHIHGKVAST